jgi:Zn-dependent peptidase ImmA (M78 family)
MTGSDKAHSERASDNQDAAELPVGLGQHRWPTSGAPIQVLGGESIVISIDQSRSLRRLPDYARLSLRIGEAVLFEDKMFRPEQLLAAVAEAWPSIAFEDPSPLIRVDAIDFGIVKLSLQRSGLNLTVFTKDRNSPRQRHDVSFGDGIEALERLGHAIAVRLPPDNPSVVNWQNRIPRNPRRFAEITSRVLNFSAEELTALGLAAPRDADELIYPSDLWMAARLVGGEIAIPTLKVVLDVVRTYPARETPALSALAEDYSASELRLAVSKAWDKGYAIALWARERLQVGEGYIDVEQMLRDFGVRIEIVDVGTRTIDAVAAWGEYGPVVIMNSSGLHSRSEAGSRASLAHELCHLIADRYGALPVAEAQGEKVRTNKEIESRASAFAAELLLSRRAAGDRLRQLGDLEQTIAALRREHGVSRTVVLRQLENHPEDPAGPTADQRKRIRELLQMMEYSP